MSFVVVNVQNKTRVRHPRTGRESYRTESAAEAARTRYIRTTGYADSDLKVMAMDAYRAQVPMRAVTNLMTGAVCLEPADTPWHCSVASESYWSA